MTKMPKPQKTQTLGEILGATAMGDIDLSKYPIGSPESRAAVRALLAQQPGMSQDDLDAMLIYSGSSSLDYQTLPSSSEVTATAAYQRGKELWDARGEKIIPYHLDPHAQRWSIASSAFELRFGREPKEGDVLRFSDVQWTQALSLACHEQFIEAFHRQIPNLMCPLKVEGGKLYRHVRPGVELRDGGFKEEIDESPEGRWRLIERQAVGESSYKMPPLEEVPTFSAVTFIGVLDGKHRCKPSVPRQDPEVSTAKRIVLALAFLCLFFSVPAFCTVPVTGRLSDLSGSGVATNTFIRFELVNCVNPRQVGSAVIINPNKDFKPNASGAISGTLIPISEITCDNGASPAYMLKRFLGSSQVGLSVTYCIDAAFNLNDPPAPCSPVPQANTVVLHSFKWRGAWDAATSYAAYDTVSYNGSSYVAKAANSNTAPDSSTVWDKMADRGLGVLDDAALVHKTGDEAISGIKTIDTVRSSDINGVAYALTGTDACSEIAAAIAALPATGGTVDARGITGAQTCAANPFDYSKIGVTVLLGAATITTNAQWVVPPHTLLLGNGIGDAGSNGTVIKAGSSFPSNNAIVRIGDGSANNVHGSRIENLALDCNGVTGCSGGYSTQANEQSGFEHLLIVNTPAGCINVEAASGGSPQTYLVKDIECYTYAAGSTSTIGVRMVGNGGGGPAEAANITASGDATHPIHAGVLLANVGGGARLNSIHAEYAAKVLHLGDATLGPVSGATLQNVTGGPGDTDVLYIENSSTQSFSATGLTKGSATNLINDVPRSTTITDIQLGSYQVGGGAIGSQPILHTSPNTYVTLAAPVLLADMNVNGHAIADGTVNAATAGMLRLGSTQTIQFRNNANNGNVNGVSKNASDQVIVGGTAGISVDSIRGARIQHLRLGPAEAVGNAMCQTGASAGASCATTFNLSASQVDTNYTAVCTVSGVATGVPFVAIGTKTATTLQVTTIAATAAGAQASEISCSVNHD